MRRAVSVCAALLLLTVFFSTGYAAQSRGRTGSISIRMTDRGEPIPGGSVTLYRVAGLSEDYRYTAEPPFGDCGVDLNRALTREDAEKLAQYAKQNRIPGQTLALGHDGAAVFAALEEGLYLLTQQEAGAGYLPVSPFLCGVPQQIGGELFYDVDASPKCAPEPTDPGGPGGPSIPQTGQLNWPVPVMGMLGLVLISAGGLLWVRRDADEP